MSKSNGELVIYYPLDMKVLAVAVVNKGVGDWAAYVGAVPGENHDREYMMVARSGTKLPYEVACVLFPKIDTQYRWRP